MQNRFQRVLRRFGVGLLSIVVVFLVIAEDVFAFAGLLLRKILPANFEEFLRSRSTVFAYGVVGIAIVIYIPVHLAEYVAFWRGYYWTGVGFSILSKIYTVSVLGYLCRVYSDRLLAVGWIKKSWDWYCASKKWLESFEWYQIAHVFVHDTKERVKGAIKAFRARFKGSSRFAVLWQTLRRRWR